MEKKECMQFFCNLCAEWATYRQFGLLDCGCMVHAVCISNWFKNAEKERCPECQEEFAPDDVRQMQMPKWRIANEKDEWCPTAWEAYMKLEEKSREHQRQKQGETEAEYMERIKREQEEEELWNCS